MNVLQADEWAVETFSRAPLGDPRRVSRLVAMAAAVAKSPGGTVTGSMATSAEKEGAFRFLESTKIDTDAVAEAVFETTALKSHDFGFVFVAVDQTDLTFTDRGGERGLGPVTDRSSETLRGMQVMNAMALDPAGTPIGMLDQQFWCRPEKKVTPKRGKDRRPPEARESWQWVISCNACVQRLARCAPETRPWFLVDRGADFHGFLTAATSQGALFTARSSYDRVIEHKGKRRMLWHTLRRQKVRARVELQVPRGPGRTRRKATLELRSISARVRISANPYPEVWADMWCVQAREVSHVPRGEERIEWKLLTTFPIKKAEHVLTVLRSYTRRWRIEEFHKTWKTGACRVEESQLRSFDALRRWSTILAAVAARIERLKLLSREQPDLDARKEFSREELDAAILLTKTKKFDPGSQLTLRDAVRLVAQVGGYMNRNGDGPPGSITIRRGLERVTPAAAVLAATKNCD